MEEILAGVLTSDFWFGFVGAVLVTAFLTQPILSALCGAGWCRIPRRLIGPAVAILVGIGIAWLWGQVGEDGGKLRALLRDGVVNGAASSIAYENIIRPWMERRKANGGTGS